MEAGPPTQNSVRSPKPWPTMSWVTTWKCAPQFLTSADSSRSAKTSKRWTAGSEAAGSRLTTSSDSELSGSPKNACLRRSFRLSR
ncbi:hypothetical protein SUDANB140_06415 [Streptomyces sp. enrichment culture]